MENEPRKGGRPPLLDDAQKKKSRAISLTDAQHMKLQTDAASQKLNISAYIIKKLKL